MANTREEALRDDVARWFDPARRRLARAYRPYRYAGMALSLLFDLGFLLWLNLGKGSRHILRIAGGSAALWGLLVLLLYVAASLPLSYVVGYRWPRHFGLVHHGLRQWLRDKATGLLIGAPVATLGSGLVQTLILEQPASWWLWIAAVAWAFSVLATYVAPVLLMPLYNRFWPMPHGSLRNELLEMASRAGTRVTDVYLMDMSRRTATANAMLTGLLGTRRMVLGDTLVSGFPEDEVKVVMAHELAHHRYDHIPRSLGLSAVALPLVFAASDWLARWASLGMGVNAPGQAGQAGPEFIALVVAGLWGLNILTAPATSWLSRYYEWQSDEFALCITQRPEAFARMIARLHDGALGDTEPPWIVKSVFYSHPPATERIVHALKWKRRSESGAAGTVR